MMGKRDNEKSSYFLCKQMTMIRAFVGMATMCEIMAKMSRGNINAEDPISKAVTDKFRAVCS